MTFNLEPTIKRLYRYRRDEDNGHHFLKIIDLLKEGDLKKTAIYIENMQDKYSWGRDEVWGFIARTNKDLASALWKEALIYHGRKIKC